MRTRIIANPVAGSFDAAEASIRAAASDDSCELCFTEKCGDAERFAREASEQGFQRVVAAGGDGTLHEVVNGVGANAEIGVGLVPLGTGNDFARAMNVPLRDPARALAIALHGPLERLDLIRCSTPDTERLVVNAAAGGLNEAIHAEVDSAIKKRWGPIAYLVSAAKQVVDPPTFDLRMRVGERGFRGSVHAVAVANSGRIGGGLPVAPSASAGDGVFEVVLLPEQSTGELITAGVELLLGMHENSHEAICLRTDAIELEVDPAMRMHLDGEGVEAARFVFQILPRSLRFARPTP
ncbi:MAG: diacylglycerol/lipid kinase family protein [Phycisphaerales bacterium]